VEELCYCYKTYEKKIPFEISLELFTWKKRQDKMTHMLEDLREILVPMCYRRKNSNPTSSRTITNLKIKESLKAKQDLTLNQLQDKE
jgi:hypothetical protein